MSDLLADVGATTADVAPRPVHPWHRLRRNTPAMLALGFLALMVACALFGSWLTRYPPNEPVGQGAFQGPSGRFWLGTDDLGRDIFSRLVAGAGSSMRASFQSVGVALLVALPIGLCAGYFGGWIDSLTMRCVDAVSSIPPLVLALAITGILGPGLPNVIIALSAIYVYVFIRLIRAQTLAVRQETFVEASQAIGTSTRRIITRRVAHNVASPVIVQSAIMLGGALLAEAALSFLGVGQQPPAASWGAMLRRGSQVMFAEPWQMVPSGMIIALTVLAFNTLGDGIRDAVGLVAPAGATKRTRPGLTPVRRDRSGATPTGHADGPGPTPLLEVRDLTVEFATEREPVTVVDQVSLAVGPGEVVGVVGESGSGKTMASLAVMRLVPPPGRITGGEVLLQGRDLLGLGFEEMRRVRGRSIAMIFQDPMTTLNPAFTVGNQVVEAIRLHEPTGRAHAQRRAVDLLARVGIPDAARRLGDYPHQFSGGMRQRVVIAMALACEPELLIADEPTTALDVTIQAQILELLRELVDERGMGLLFVTHDLGVIAEMADRVVVMYAGQVVEQATADELFHRPHHPYSDGLLRAMPQATASSARLAAIPGRVPPAGLMPTGCRFHPRCRFAGVDCDAAPVPLVARGDGSHVRCVRADELEPELAR